MRLTLLVRRLEGPTSTAALPSMASSNRIRGDVAAAQRGCRTCVMPTSGRRLNGLVPILPKERDPRLIIVRRGGTLTDEHHVLLAEWAVLCAEHVLPLFEQEQPSDPRPREAINVGRAWIRGEVRVGDADRVAFATNAAARGLAGAAKFAALAAGRAVAVAHVAAHDLSAAAYAIRAACASAPAGETEAARVRELGWQRDQIPVEARDLVLHDQRRRSAICWHVFDD
jgi:hypothetical protein